MADYVVYSKLMLEVTFAIFCRSMQVFIGLGFPYEGPAPLEAIAQGCIFLNAKVTCELAVKGNCTCAEDYAKSCLNPKYKCDEPLPWERGCRKCTARQGDIVFSNNNNIDFIFTTFKRPL